MWYIPVLSVVLCPWTRAAKDFVSVSVCPPGPSEWQVQEQAKKCQDPTPDYLCAAVEYEPGHYGEICTKLGLSPPGTYSTQFDIVNKYIRASFLIIYKVDIFVPFVMKRTCSFVFSYCTKAEICHNNVSRRPTRTQSNLYTKYRFLLDKVKSQLVSM